MLFEREALALATYLTGKFDKLDSGRYSVWVPTADAMLAAKVTTEDFGHPICRKRLKFILRGVQLDCVFRGTFIYLYATKKRIKDAPPEKSKPRVAVIVVGGNVVNVVSDIDVEVYMLDYDNHAEDDHTHQTQTPFVGNDLLAETFAEWDEDAEKNRKLSGELTS